jgi:hypothetical protein
MSELDNYLDEEGRLKEWPGRQKKQAHREARDYLASKIPSGREFTEAEINAILNEWHLFGDPALLRRELLDARWLKRTRDGKTYWRILFNKMG